MIADSVRLHVPPITSRWTISETSSRTYTCVCSETTRASQRTHRSDRARRACSWVASLVQHRHPHSILVHTINDGTLETQHHHRLHCSFQILHITDQFLDTIRDNDHWKFPKRLHVIPDKTLVVYKMHIRVLSNSNNSLVVNRHACVSVQRLQQTLVTIVLLDVGGHASNKKTLLVRYLRTCHIHELFLVNGP